MNKLAVVQGVIAELVTQQQRNLLHKVQKLLLQAVAKRPLSRQQKKSMEYHLLQIRQA